MNMDERTFRLGIWMVKPEKTDEFIKAWQASVDWLAKSHPEGWQGEALLLQDLGTAEKFISFAWTSMPHATEELLAGQEFRAFFARMRDLSEMIQPHQMRLAGYSAAQQAAD